MTALFVDSSVLVRRYDMTEAGSARVEALCAPESQNTIFIARHGSIEIASALGRKRREGLLDAGELQRRWQLFQVHWRYHYGVVELNRETYDRAERLVLAHPLRAFDALHVAAALVTVARLSLIDAVFCTADTRQSLVAREEGFDVEFIA